jgi:FkbM family methyltransferase
MSCNYFALSKPNNTDVSYDNENQISVFNSKTYILPKNNIEYYKLNGLFENHLIDWANQFCSKDKIMLDIGAHSGTYTVSLANNCKHVYAFEPQKMTYYALCGSIVLSNIQNATCINLGLGSEEQVGKQILNIISLDGGGSTLHNNINTAILNTEEIEIRTLDSFGLNNIGFIKIDVEDNELEVLRGSIQTLQNSNYPRILFESNNKNIKLFEFLIQMNYEIVNIRGYKNMFLANHKNY